MLCCVSGQKGKGILGIGCLLSRAVMLPTMSVDLLVMSVIQSCDCWQGCTQYIVAESISLLLPSDSSFYI